MPFGALPLPKGILRGGKRGRRGWLGPKEASLFAWGTEGTSHLAPDTRIVVFRYAGLLVKTVVLARRDTGMRLKMPVFANMDVERKHSRGPGRACALGYARCVVKTAMLAIRDVGFQTKTTVLAIPGVGFFIKTMVIAFQDAGYLVKK